jgi:hypothetical protein
LLRAVRNVLAELVDLAVRGCEELAQQLRVLLGLHGAREQAAVLGAHRYFGLTV